MNKIYPAKRAFWICNCTPQKDRLKQKKPPDGRRPFLLLHLFYNRKNEGHKSFGKADALFLSNKSGKTFAVSHIFVFCPAGSNRMTAFKLAAIIIKRNVREHKIKILSLFIRRKAFPCCRQIISELSVRRVHYNATIPAKSSGNN